MLLRGMRTQTVNPTGVLENGLGQSDQYGRKERESGIWDRES